MFYYLLGFVAGLLVFLTIPALGVEEPPRIQYLGAVRLGDGVSRRSVGKKQPSPKSRPSTGDASKPEVGSERHAGSAREAKFEHEAANSAGSGPSSETLRREFNGVLDGRPSGRGVRRVLLTNGRTFSFEEPARAFVPFLGSGFIQYQKVGGLLEYVTPAGELLWKKDYATYPYSDPTGKLLLFVSGDANDAIIGDENGTAITRTSGDFMSHHCFAQRALGVGLVFSGTALRVFDEKGTLLLEWKPEGRFFLKSCALSAGGGRVALHYEAEGADWIVALGVQAGGRPKRLWRTRLETRYPHLLMMALGDNGLLVGAPDRTFYLDDDGDVIWFRRARKAGTYRPVYAEAGLSVYGLEDDAFFTDGHGRSLATFRLPFAGAPWRVQPGRQARTVAAQSGGMVLFFRMTPAGS